MRGGATEVYETQKWATSKERLRTTGLDQPNYNRSRGSSVNIVTKLRAR
jgi:hypothetical protein